MKIMKKKELIPHQLFKLNKHMKLQLNLEGEWHQIFFVSVFQIEMQVCFFSFAAAFGAKRKQQL